MHCSNCDRCRGFRRIDVVEKRYLEEALAESYAQLPRRQRIFDGVADHHRGRVRHDRRRRRDVPGIHCRRGLGRRRGNPGRIRPVARGRGRARRAAVLQGRAAGDPAHTRRAKGAAATARRLHVDRTARDPRRRSRPHRAHGRADHRCLHPRAQARRVRHQRRRVPRHVPRVVAQPVAGPQRAGLGADVLQHQATCERGIGARAQAAVRGHQTPGRYRCVWRAGVDMELIANVGAKR